MCSNQLHSLINAADINTLAAYIYASVNQQISL